MKSILLLSWFFMGQLFFPVSNNESYLSYIDEHKDIAIQEMDRTGVPASIKLAQGLLESHAGQSDLARHANNHFGIKCGSYWEENYQDDCYYKEDDEYDEHGRKKKSCFRKYRNTAQCFIAHSDFLRDPKKAHRYGRLFELDPKDYVGWAYGLRAAGYATDPKYPNKLIKVIEDYHLYKYDYKALAKEHIDVVDVDEYPPKEDKRPLRKVNINSVEAVFAREGDTPWYIAEKMEVPIDHLMKYNEHLDSKVGDLEKGTTVFLQKKRKRYLGRRNYHYVKNGDRMMDIATTYGIELESLYKRNRMPEGMEPFPGERIYIRKKRKKDNPPRYTEPENLEPVESPEDQQEEELNEAGQLLTNTDPHEEDDSDAHISAATDKEEMVQKLTVANKDWGQDEHLDFALAVGQVIDSSKNESEGDINKLLRINTHRPPVSQPEEKEEEKEALSFEIIMEKETPQKSQRINQGPTAEYHEVQPGDTLYALYREYGTPVDKLREMNDLTSNVIHTGQVLRVK